MDHMHERLEALEQRTQTVERQLRWWRGLAGGLLVLAVLTWALPTGTAQEESTGGARGSLPQRLAAMEDLLMHFTRVGNEVIITGANLSIVNGLGQIDCFDAQGDPIPDCPNGLGNLIVGYNELRDEPPEENIRTGSHTVVVGQFNNFSTSGGLVVGAVNEIRGNFAVVSGGNRNTASGAVATVCGGTENTASGNLAVVSGGSGNTASGDYSSVSGGFQRTAAGKFDWVAGPLFADA
jgi:hypothetical protein